MHKGTCFKNKNVHKKDQQCSRGSACILNVPLSNMNFKCWSALCLCLNKWSSNAIILATGSFRGPLHLLVYFLPSHGSYLCLFRFTQNVYEFYFSFIYTFSTVDGIGLHLVPNSHGQRHLFLVTLGSHPLHTNSHQDGESGAEVGGLKYENWKPNCFSHCLHQGRVCLGTATGKKKVKMVTKQHFEMKRDSFFPGRARGDSTRRMDRPLWTGFVLGRRQKRDTLYFIFLIALNSVFFFLF